MKKKIFLVAMACSLALTACASQQVQTPSTDTGETESSQVVTETTQETSSSAEAMSEQKNYLEDTALSTDVITMTVPDEFKGKFLATVSNDQICIYDKECVDSGFEGYVFSVVTTTDNGIYAGGMFEKVGEVFSPEGEIYNVSRGFASEIQWDYNQGMEMPEAYKKLYDAAESIIEGIQGNDGKTFVYKSGTKGEEIYPYTLSTYVTALQDGWDEDKFEEAGMSPEFYLMYQNDGDKAFDRIGYAFRDINHDGIDELLMGEIDDSKAPSVVYDVYSTINRSPAKAVSGSARDRYYVLEYGGLANEYSNSAMESGVNFYDIDVNTAEVFYQYSLKYDGIADEKNPWFVSYDGKTWDPMTEEDYNERYNRAAEQYLKLDFKPLSDIVPIDYSKVDLSKYDTFTKMLDDFKPGMGYANIQLDGTDVFLVSSGTYNGENGTKNAMDASIFMYKNQKIVYLGQAASSGTAYPLSVLDGKLYTGGHHRVIKNTVTDGKLITVEMADETFDTSGNATYHYGSDEGKGYKEDEVKDDSHLTTLFDEYSKAEPIDFSVEK